MNDHGNYRRRGSEDEYDRIRGRERVWSAEWDPNRDGKRSNERTCFLNKKRLDCDGGEG